MREADNREWTRMHAKAKAVAGPMRRKQSYCSVLRNYLIWI
jgi:hypothetical protein